jgi:hypothetical protein
MPRVAFHKDVLDGSTDILIRWWYLLELSGMFFELLFNVLHQPLWKYESTVYAYAYSNLMAWPSFPFQKTCLSILLTNEKRRPSVIVVGHDSNHRKTPTEFLQVMITSPVSNQCAPPTRRGIGLLLSSEAETWFSKGCTRTCTATAPSEQRAPSEIFTWNCYNFSQSLASWHRSGNIQDCLNPPKSSFSQSSL